MIPRRWVQRTPRIGVGYAGAWAAKPLRFLFEPGRLEPRARRLHPLALALCVGVILLAFGCIVAPVGVIHGVAVWLGLL